MMKEILKSEDPLKAVENLYMDCKGTLQEILDSIYEQGWYDEAVSFLRKVLNDGFELKREDKVVLRKLVEYELLFYDPIGRQVKFQSRLDERAIRETLEKEAL